VTHSHGDGAHHHEGGGGGLGLAVVVIGGAIAVTSPVVIAVTRAVVLGVLLTAGVIVAAALAFLVHVIVRELRQLPARPQHPPVSGPRAVPALTARVIRGDVISRTTGSPQAIESPAGDLAPVAGGRQGGRRYRKAAPR
jgi:hypothetical protein